MKLKFYFGTPGWGWRLYGVALGESWFIGLSINNTGKEGRR